ncbi:MAG: hypothetical protein GY868_18685, partial [Deltaproteobacteria bacterium]|nr:hypothetical protein [Deltaproteobacteria bacterium]
GGSHRNAGFFEELSAIRSRYADLLAEPRIPKGKIAELFSPAASYVTLVRDQASRAMELYCEYLECYCEMAGSAVPVPEAEQLNARHDFETYVDVMIEHDPAMKNAHLCFGKKQGRAWALNLFFDRQVAVKAFK